MTVFNPVEAQQHITEARKMGEESQPVVARPILKLLAADIESAVEYIAELEKRHENTVQKLGRQLGYEGIRGMGSEAIADEVVVELVRLEAEVARLNSQIARDKRVNDSVDSWIELANRYESKLNAVHTYINENEHPDYWDVPCVYTKDLRAILTTVSTEPERN